MIQLLPTFYGLERENHYVHVREFEEVVTTFQGRPNAINNVKFRFFPFSLKDSAKVLLYSLKPRSIGNWDEMTQVFFHKHFPTHKTNNFKKQIQNVTQNDSDVVTQTFQVITYY